MGKYILFAIPAVISAAAVVLGLIQGSGEPRKKLARSVLLLGALALLCFGGEFALSRMGMGWRCTPFNLMLFLCAVLLAVTLWRCMNVLSLLEGTRSVIQASGFVSLALVLMITLVGTPLYFLLFSWHDKLAPHNEQMIVCANDMHGGSGSWRYYAHINNLVHGEEIERHDGWYGTPPLFTAAFYFPLAPL
jgi:hypothetical protein